ncbi:TPA: long polar fimbrial protein LpfE [Escherichia coli]|nr:long polar fimbrial protein LpfE [Escherichia coli]HCP1393825.1 long polar fimbrial protein LpfE [Escherichia coli]HCP1508221.1 long polar fimbrial protein LpfE [Escherichia coli]HCP1664852.1 long polar fimbrial protein LpfE [Escherichia coli]HCP1806403.1 long polar fimbrial protein LpfE [Escherichia coli]
MKRTILALCLLPISLSTMALTDLGAKGDLKFTLQIRQGACELVKDNIEVDLGRAVLKQPVRIGTELNPTTFSIGLKNCSEVVRAYVTMNGTPNMDDPNLFALDAGGATGVGLKIKTAAGVQQFPKNTTPTPIEFAINSDGSHQLNYIASYVPIRADATIGRADATVDFTVQYE